MHWNLSYSPETPNLGQIRRFLEPCDLEIWRMTLKNNRAPLLSNIKLYASFHHHMWIQTGVTVQKRLSWFVTSVTLTFDLWPWPFAWTLLWSLVITPENFMMIRWWEHSQKGVTDRQTDGQTENTICRAAWSQLKMQSEVNDLIPFITSYSMLPGVWFLVGSTASHLLPTSHPGWVHRCQCPQNCLKYCKWDSTACSQHICLLVFKVVYAR